MTRIKRLAAITGLLCLAALVMVPGASFYYESGAGVNCTKCHEMNQPYDLWHTSSHREVGCPACHGGAFTTDLSFHMTNATRLYDHVAGEVPAAIRIRNADALKMQQRCQNCHRQEFAEWQSGPHSATYERIFADKPHNKKRALMDDCLRCHGMHFEGGIRDLVTPLDTRGPWRVMPAGLGASPTMPCVTCHSVHREGRLLKKTGVEGRVPGPTQEINRPSLAFFDRRSQKHVPVADLPLPVMLQDERAVRMSPDRRQALCYQCHAAEASQQVGSGDDRTPAGVHEGISCLSCHLNHGTKTRASCASCHPKMSNCGLDVEKMDTTFLNPESRHNIHWVRCADCHPSGVPKKKETNRL